LFVKRMIKFYCDICKKEIVKENSLFGNFSYFVRKTIFLKHQKANEVDKVDMMICEGCTDGLKNYVEGQIGINKV